MRRDLEQIIRSIADSQRMAEREALTEYRRGDHEKAHYWDGRAQQCQETLAQLNQLLAQWED
jgi:hypothetical protein